jgi:hypothetical protein
MKQILTNYTFSTSGKSLTLPDFGVSHSLDLKRLYLITDVTTNKILYNFADNTVATATISSNNVITLSVLQGGESNSDSLQIIYDTVVGDPVYELPLTGLTDGANVANVVAGDSGYNGIATSSATKTISFTTSAAGAQTLLANTNVEGYAWILVQFSVNSTVGLALTGQFSATSGGSYANANSFSTTNSVIPTGLGTATSVIYGSPVVGNYFQVAISALTSGTLTGSITLSSTARPYGGMFAAQSGAWTVGSSSAVGSAVPANAFYIGGIQSGNLATPNVGNGNADSYSAAANGLVTVGLGSVYNGTSWDRQRSASTVAGTTGTGLPGAGVLGYDGTNWRALSTSSSGVLSVSSAPATSGGLSAATGSIGATATSVKASAGQVYGYTFYNNNSTIAYVQFFNTAVGSVTLGTTAPVYSIGLPANSGANVSLQQGIAHSAAIVIGITTTRAGNTSPTNTVDYNIFYT